MKNCRDCGKPRGHENPLISRCKECQYAKSSLKRTELKPGPPPKKFGKKRITRIKEYGSECKVFVEIWGERMNFEGKRECENCGEHIKFFHSSCFAHKLAKGANPKLRYEKGNIALVHGIFEVKNEKTGLTYNCHQEYDKKFREGERI